MFYLLEYKGNFTFQDLSQKKCFDLCFVVTMPQARADFGCFFFFWFGQHLAFGQQGLAARKDLKILLTVCQISQTSLR